MKSPLVETISKQQIIKALSSSDFNAEEYMKIFEEEWKRASLKYKQLVGKEPNIVWAYVMKLFSLVKKENFKDKEELIQLAAAPLWLFSLITENKIKVSESKSSYFERFMKLKSSLDLFFWTNDFTDSFERDLIEELKEATVKTWYKPVVKGGNFEIYQITNYAEARAIGADTKWCISGSEEGRGHCTHYLKNSDLYALILNKGREKYLLAIPNAQNRARFEAIIEKEAQKLFHEKEEERKSKYRNSELNLYYKIENNKKFLKDYSNQIFNSDFAKDSSDEEVIYRIIAFFPKTYQTIYERSGGLVDVFKEMIMSTTITNLTKTFNQGTETDKFYEKSYSTFVNLVHEEMISEYIQYYFTPITKITPTKMRIIERVFSYLYGNIVNLPEDEKIDFKDFAKNAVLESDFNYFPIQNTVLAGIYQNFFEFADKRNMHNISIWEYFPYFRQVSPVVEKMAKWVGDCERIYTSYTDWQLHPEKLIQYQIYQRYLELVEDELLRNQTRLNLDEYFEKYKETMQNQIEFFVEKFNEIANRVQRLFSSMSKEHLYSEFQRIIIKSIFTQKIAENYSYLYDKETPLEAKILLSIDYHKFEDERRYFFSDFYLYYMTLVQLRKSSNTDELFPILKEKASDMLYHLSNKAALL